MLPVFRRRAHNTDATSTAADVLTLDTRWSDARRADTPLPPLPSSCGAMVESMSAEFTGKQAASAVRLQQQQRQQYSGSRTRVASAAGVRKSRSLHSSAVTLSQLTTNPYLISSDDVTSLADCQPLNHLQHHQQPQQCVQTVRCHDDVDDVDDAAVNSDQRMQSGRPGTQRHHAVSYSATSSHTLLL